MGRRLAQQKEGTAGPPLLRDQPAPTRVKQVVRLTRLTSRTVEDSRGLLPIRDDHLDAKPSATCVAVHG